MKDENQMAGIKQQNCKQIQCLLAAIFAAGASCVSSARSDASPPATPVIAPTESLLHCPFQWPEGPQSAVNCELPAAYRPSQNPILRQPDNGSNLRKDLFQSLLPSDQASDYKGIFVYSDFVLRAFGVEGTFNNQKMGTALYSSMGHVVTNPKFSPNGKYISYDDGYKDLYSKFDIMVWDIFGKKIIKVDGDELSDPGHWDYLWSPDGEKIAYVSGGEFNQDNSDLSLSVFDVAQNQHKEIGQEATVRQGAYTYSSLKQFSWFNKDEILYSKTDRRQADYPSGNWEPEFPHAAIYKINIATRKSTKLIDDAFAPHPSPDGKWIAFVGWPRQPPASQKRNLQALPLNLYLFNTSTKNITLVSGVKMGVAEQTWQRDLSLAWTPDSHSLAAALFFEESIPSADDTYTLYQIQSAKIQTIDLPKAPSQAPATHLLQEMKFEGFHPHPWHPFAFHSILKDNRTAFIVRRNLKINSSPMPNEEVDLLLALNLQTGALSNVAKFSNYTDGWDWAECAP